MIPLLATAGLLFVVICGLQFLWLLARLIWTFLCLVEALGRLALSYITFRPPLSREDVWMARARLDQQKATYPGCRLGLMACYSQTCGCAGDRPTEEWVRARAARIKTLEEG